MTNKTQIDLYREYVRVSDMCDSYNKEHASDIKPWDCVKLDNDTRPNGIKHPKFDGIPDRYKFAIAILEERPVWVGDTVYRKNENWSMVVGISNLVKITDDYYTWTPPTQKRTFMLNGVELPCPVKVNKLLPVSRRMEIDSFYFYFDSQEDKQNAAGKLICLLTEAIDKE